MTDPDLISLFVAPLEQIEIPYMITGGVASVIYGEPRFTRDIDIILELRSERIASLASAFPSDSFYVPPSETLRDETARREGGHFNLIHRETALRADVYLFGNDPLHEWAFQHRARVRVGDLDIRVAPIEYVIVRKLEYFRMSRYDRHLRDVALMLRISGHIVDAATLDRWIDERGLGEEFDLARTYPDQ